MRKNAFRVWTKVLTFLYFFSLFKNCSSGFTVTPSVTRFSIKYESDMWWRLSKNIAKYGRP